MFDIRKKQQTDVAQTPFRLRCICLLCVLLWCGCIAACLWRMFAACTVPEDRRRMALPAGMLAALLLAAMGALYYFLVRPLLRLEKGLSSFQADDFELSMHGTEGAPSLLSFFSNLQVLIGQMKTLILRESNAQLMKKQAQLDGLQSQINPHFLYNTLDTIRGCARVAGHEDIAEMTLALSKLFRYSISNYNDLVSLEEELHAVQNYFLIQNFRFGNRFHLECRIDEDTRRHKVPKMLIQPLVENAVRHGLEARRDNGAIIIQAYRTEDRLVICIDDDGIGMDADRLNEINDMLRDNGNPVMKKKTGTSIGLHNINSRMRLLFGDSYHFSVCSTKNVGTNVRVSMPLI